MKETDVGGSIKILLEDSDEPRIISRLGAPNNKSGCVVEVEYNNDESLLIIDDVDNSYGDTASKPFCCIGMTDEELEEICAALIFLRNIRRRSRKNSKR
jgi:hypothetical protein